MLNKKSLDFKQFRKLPLAESEINRQILPLVLSVDFYLIKKTK